MFRSTTLAELSATVRSIKKMQTDFNLRPPTELETLAQAAYIAVHV